MNEIVAHRADGPERSPTSWQAGTIRRQLLGASLFPLAFFSMLIVLAAGATLHELTTSLALDRSKMEARAFADELGLQGSQGQDDLGRLLGQLQAAEARDEQMAVVDASGRVLSSAGSTLVDPRTFGAQAAATAGGSALRGILITPSLSQDQLILTSAPIPGTQNALVVVQQLDPFLSPANNLELLLAGLLLMGTLLSLLTLSISIGRIMRPISDLAATAGLAIPGSIFHPLPERGPLELQSLTASFNRMVIQLAEQQATLRQFAQKALLSQEEERQRLSHELHDGTVQDLIGLAQRLELCQREMDVDPERARRRLEELRALAQTSLAEVRRISNALRPSILQDLGLPAALRVLCRELQDAMPGITCDCLLKQDARDGRLQPDMELAIFRVAQEALTNIRKHAREATEVCLELDVQQNSVCLGVRDNGRGITEPNIPQLVREGHLGYAGMHERARFFGGKLEVTATPENGTIVRMELPR